MSEPERIPWNRPRGLGDIVAIVAQPIAKTIDAVLKTDLEHCESCKARQDALNQRFPVK